MERPPQRRRRRSPQPTTFHLTADDTDLDFEPRGWTRSPFGPRTTRNRFDLWPKSLPEKEGQIADDVEGFEQDEQQRLWNLRPRKSGGPKNGTDIGGNGVGGSVEKHKESGGARAKSGGGDG